MQQAVTIGGESVGYTLTTKAIVAVLGKAYIYRIPTFEDVLKIVYLGLDRQCGHTAESFVNAYLRGEIYTTRKRGQYPLSVTRLRVQNRIRQINSEHKPTP